MRAHAIFDPEVEHRAVLNRIADDLRQRGVVVAVETPYLTESGVTYQPDLVLHTSADTMLVVEVKTSPDTANAGGTLSWEPAAQLASFVEHVSTTEHKHVVPVLTVVGGRMSPALHRFAAERGVRILQVHAADEISKALAFEIGM
ncbi:MAG: hypothetical protein ACR2H9_08945 [Longimicrobiaceae bacterium]